MKKETKAFIVMTLFGCCLLAVSSWLNDKITSTDNDNHFSLTPFLVKNVYGLKIKSVDGSRHFFAGIQRETKQLKKDKSNFFTPQNVLVSKKITNGNLSEYKINLGVVEVLLKIFSYHQTPPEEGSHNPSENELKHLNYIIENSACTKCNKDDAILLKKDNPNNSRPNDLKESKVTAVFAALIQIIPK